MSSEEDLVYRLRKRAEIRKRIRSEPDRIASILEEAADEIQKLREATKQ